MDKVYQTDMSALAYPDWVTFVFDHEVPPDRFDLDARWHWNNDSDSSIDSEFPIGDPTVLVAHFTQLCNHFVEVTERFSLPQIDQGIWFLLSEPIRFGDYLVNKDIPLDARLNCIRSMYRVYADFVAKSEVECMENCFDMWWDLLASALLSPIRFRRYGDEFWTTPKTADFWAKLRIVKVQELDNDELQVQNVMFDALCKILKLEDGRCQAFALHGLGHLEHPNRFEAVQKYINDHRGDWNDDGIAWIESCRDGTVM